MALKESTVITRNIYLNDLSFGIPRFETYGSGLIALLITR